MRTEAVRCRAGILPADSMTSAASPDLGVGASMAALQAPLCAGLRPRTQIDRRSPAPLAMMETCRSADTARSGDRRRTAGRQSGDESPHSITISTADSRPPRATNIPLPCAMAPLTGPFTVMRCCPAALRPLAVRLRLLGSWADHAGCRRFFFALLCEGLRPRTLIDRRSPALGTTLETCRSATAARSGDRRRTRFLHSSIDVSPEAAHG
jgi:hypothetical protein